ncbi:MAG: hypothetical protein Q8880_00700 [Bacteroidota bacterium]|nr:hypothetical protein [Bacteroidota bacterium]
MLNYKFDTINFEKEKPELFNYIKKIISCNDSVEMQKYILFPFIDIRCLCDPYGLNHSNPYFFENHTLHAKIENDSDVIKYLHQHNNCVNPYAFYQVKYTYNKNFKEELTKQNLSLGEYFFKDPSNRLAYAGWYIRYYKGIHTKYSDDFLQHQVGNNHIFTFAFNNKEINVPIIQIYFMSIFKYNGEYKLCYDGFEFR